MIIHLKRVIILYCDIDIEYNISMSLQIISPTARLYSHNKRAITENIYIYNYYEKLINNTSKPVSECNYLQIYLFLCINAQSACQYWKINLDTVILHRSEGVYFVIMTKCVLMVWLCKPFYHSNKANMTMNWKAKPQSYTLASLCRSSLK